MKNETKLTYVAVDRKTGAHLRDATPAEIAGYLAAKAARPYGFDRATVVDGVLIDTYTGPGGWSAEW